MIPRPTRRRSPSIKDYCLQVWIRPINNSYLLNIQYVLLLFNRGKARKEITSKLGVNTRQVSNKIKSRHVMPLKPSGRLLTLISDGIDELEDFNFTCRERRQTTYWILQLALPGNDV